MSIWRRLVFLRALSTLLFCVGMTILPFLAAADFVVWAACGDETGIGCVQLIENAITSSAIVELGDIDLIADEP